MKRIRRRAIGTVQAGWLIGYALAALAYYVIFSLLPARVAWRTLFPVGVLPALSAFWMRRNAQESESFMAISAVLETTNMLTNLRLMFSRNMIGRTLMTLCMHGSQHRPGPHASFTRRRFTLILRRPTQL
ncbi:MFS transporter [Paraburkholderia sp. BCC1885]|uniref:MFS transporter n=1 Tax=Paraburkholderia sp. BCC1885 TaxID=2562669 RepID=UPI0011835098|nr:MFS transporter [Paraburkholderia sp. BCC1885]